MGAHRSRKIFSILAILTLAIVLTSIFVACNKPDAQGSGYKVTIHQNNGQEDIVWDIATVVPVIEKEGYHIVGYYLDVNFTISTSLESLQATGLANNVEVYIKWEKDRCDHVTVIDKAVAATCIKTGLTEGKHCSVCGDVLVAQQIIPALGHDIEHHNAKESGCSQAGWEAYDTCKRDGCDYTTYKELPLRPHTESDWIVDRESTCVQEGLKHTECTVCHKIIKTEKIEKGEHVISDWIIDVEATCEEEGYKKKLCMRCLTLLDEEVIPAKKHCDKEWRVDYYPTCTNWGSEHLYCMYCDVFFDYHNLEPLGHNPEHHDGKDATCTEAGWEAYDTCKRDGCTYTTYEEIPSTGHTESDWIIDVPATCTSSGSKHKECADCHEVLESATINAFGHDIEHHDAKEASCSAVGWEAYDTCARENCTYTTYKEISKLEHTKSDWITDTDAGIKYIECTVCHTVLQTQALPTHEHTISDWIIDQKGTCIASGTKHKECIYCHEVMETGVDNSGIHVNTYEGPDEYVSATCTKDGGYYLLVCCSDCNTTISRTYNVISALGHDPEHHDGKDATCTEAGWKAYDTCKRENCTYTTYKEISKLEHTKSDWITDTDAGIKYIECTVCHTVLQTQDLSSHVHTESNWIIDISATCTSDGSKHIECTVCKDVLKTETIDALGHSFSSEWTYDGAGHWRDATCGHSVTAGNATHTYDSEWNCTVCGYHDGSLHGTEIKFNTLTLKGLTAMGKVSNDTTTFSFISEVSVAKGATFSVYSDINGTNIIRTKTISLEIGDNTCYILVENGDDIALYTVTVRRRPIYKVSFAVNGGESVDTQNIEEDDYATMPTTVRKGYTFDKWDWDFEKPITANTVVTASWNIITYDIIYDLNIPTDSVSQDVDNSQNPTTYTVEDGIIFAVPIRVGYTFTGWSVANIAKGTIDTVTTVASWEAINYDIVYDFGDVESVSKATNNELNPATYTIEDDIAFAAPTRKGYTFTGWSVANIAKGTIDTVTTVANWEVINYYIVYDLNVPADSVSQDVDNSQNPTIYTVEDGIIFAVPTRKGYTFTGWSVSEIAKGTIDTVTTVASWEAINYDIVYDFCDAESVSKATNNELNPATYTIEDDITFAEPTRADYIFVKWDKSIAKGTTDTQTITASWNVITYTITYNLNGWTNADNNKQIYTIEDQTFSLYDGIYGESLFLGWYLDEEYTNCIAQIDATTRQDYIVYAMPDCGATKGLVIQNGIVKSYSGQSTSVVIPTYYKGYSVFGINASAFSGCSGLTSITIPDSVTSIGSSAFSGCSGLESITLPFVGAKAGVTSSDTYQYPFGYIFGTSSYTGGTATKQYYYGSSTSSTTYNTYYIPSSLKSVTITGGNILYGAFYNCSGLTSITISDSVTSIGRYAFYNCSGLTSVTIGNGVTSIDSYAFYNCSSLTSIYYTGDVAGWCGISGLDEIMSSSRTLYIGGTKVEGDLVIPDGVTSIPSYAFYYCSGLTSITIPDSVTSIGSYAFRGCSGLTSVTIGNGVKSIGDYAFSRCSGLTSITIPDSVTSIGSGAFGGCSSLESMTIPFVGAKAGVTNSDTYQYPFGYIFGTSSYTGGTATTQYYYGSSTSSTTESTYYIPSSLKSVTITGGNILYGAFYNCRGLTSVTIGNSVTRIGERAFYNCRGLTSVTIGNGVTSIGSYAFYNCSGLTSITIPNSVARIGSYAFYNCSGLTSVTIGNSVTSIGECAFSGCSGLTSIIIPDSVTSMGSSAFSGCSGLESITLPFVGAKAGVTSSDTYQYPFGYIFGTSSYTGGTATKQYYHGSSTTSSTYYIPSSLKSVTITGGSSIGSYAFYNCSGLASVTIGNSVTSIGFEAFRYCSGLTSIYYTGDIAGWCGLSGLDKIMSSSRTLYIGGTKVEGDLVIPDGVMSISSCAFRGCSDLTSVFIPDSVTSIDSSAFEYCSGLTSVTVSSDNTKYHSVGNCLIETNSKTLRLGCRNSIIPDDGSVTSIGYDAFSGCSGLTSITIPDSVTSIGSYAFSGCSGLTSITIPDSVTSIGSDAFYGCSGLTSITIPAGVTSIGSYAFAYCSGLTSITIPDSVTSIGSYAFYGCSGLTSVTIGNSVTSIGTYAFYGCHNLIEVYNKSSLTITAGDSVNGYVAYYAKNVYTDAEGESMLSTDENGYVTYTDGDEKILVAYTGTETVLILPSDISQIYQYAFYNCTSLTGIIIPNSVTSIKPSTFYGCSGLTNITIPDSVTSIGEGAFEFCSGLTSITIPDSVTSIGYGAFSRCSGLESITLPFVGAKAGVTSSDTYQYPFGYIFGTLSYTGGTATKQYYYGSSTSETTYSTYYIPSSLKSVTITGGNILYGAFYGCSGLTSVTIGNSVTSIGSSAFKNCSGLTSIYYTGDIAGWCGLSGLDKIMSSSRTLYIGGTKVEGDLVIPDGVMSISSCAFRGCSDLTSVFIPDSVTSIGAEAFRYCSGLTSITIGNSVTSIGSSAFCGCSGLTSITIPDSVTSIGSYAFEDCSGLTSITIPDSVTSIGEGAFYGCSGLTSVTIGNSVTSIGNYAFYGCSGLTSITIGNSVTSIGSSAFSGCSGLTSIYYTGDVAGWCGISGLGNIMSSLRTLYIGGTKVEGDLVIPNGVTSIQSCAFRYCSGLTSVTIGNSVTSIGDYAFYNCYKLIEIHNKSSLTITAGSSNNGYVAYYAKNVYTDTEGESKLSTDDNGYVIYADGDEKVLVGYTGTETALTLPSDISQIYRYAFYDCSGLTSVTIGNSVTSIGYDAFSGCSGLTSITIPNGVTSIGSSAFRGCRGLESITLPFVGAKAGVTSSDTYQYPFGYIFGTLSYTGGTATKQYYYGSSTSETTYSTYYIPSSLKSVTITGGNILYGAFYGCSGLTSITIPDSVTSIGSDAFRGCSGLTSITIPDSVTRIGSSAFKYCRGLTSITIPFVGATKDGTSNTHFGYIFGASSYSENSSCVPSSLKTVVITGGSSIGSYAFEDCSGLTNITIPDSVTSIGSYAFAYCRGLTSMTIPNSVTSIGSYAFAYCRGLTSMTIPNSVTSIGSYAFAYCRGLTNITIPDSVTSIGNYAFYGCSGLTSITIGNSVTSIGSSAFSGCSGLTSIYYTGDVAGWCGISGLGNIMSSLRTLYIGGTKVEGDLVIPNGVTSIQSCAFRYCSGLTSITIPNSVTSIGSYAFAYCSGLTSITIPDSVTSIGEDAFRGCSGLTSITIPNGVTSIPSYAFYGCSGLTRIDFDGTMEEWNAISKGYDWKYNVPSSCKVYCTDGTISI